jgi:hypothetical protein
MPENGRLPGDFQIFCIMESSLFRQKIVVGGNLRIDDR